MFRKIDASKLKPARPLLIWDGECKFCQYWILRLRPVFSENIEIEPYQKIDVENTGIAKKDYAAAARLIDTDGKVYSGPAVFYKALENKRGEFLLFLYNNSGSFRWLNDYAYEIIAKNRGAFFTLTKRLWGKNPRSPKPYWLFHLVVFLFLLILMAFFTRSKKK